MANRNKESIPAARRPGDTDDTLESDRLNSIIRWGAVFSVVLALFLPIYWLQEAGERKAKEVDFLQSSIDRGRFYFAFNIDPETGEHPDPATGDPAGLPFECARCHGTNLEGGMNTFVDPRTGESRTVAVPELKHVFARYETPPPGYGSAREYLTAVIERGRTDGVLGLPFDMPAWSNKFGGPLTEQLIQDLLNYIEVVQETGKVVVEGPVDGAAVFAQFCATCHGVNGEGGSGPRFIGGSEEAQFPDIQDHIDFVTSGSTAGIAYGTSGQGTGAMPGWGTTLTPEQIMAVVEYERSL